MLNYDFRNLLSAFEFECFTRDLINAHEGIQLSNFAEGKDGGIDLRYYSNKDNSVIVQVKRYKGYSELKSVLKKEAAKVQILKPSRYILSTSVDLTPTNKEEIMTMFSPFIQNERDVLAKQDLNKILALHPDVEQKYYKLWLASTSVLNSILHKNIVNWTDFEKEEIQSTVRTYVMNDSFNDALTKLINNRYVIISGEPGIGKTTLARMLVLFLLSDKFADRLNTTNYEEFYYSNNDINDFARVFQMGRRQVFFYDDFLGRTALEEGEKNFDARIVAFIRACQREKDKLFILTTREYILQKGVTHYSRFKEGKGIEMSKCIVDISKYSRFIRAQILCNHLVANEIPQRYINEIIKEKNYLKIIDHPHFSPRIIETFISNGTHERCKPEEYFNIILGYFDHPDSVWLDAFGRLSTLEQEALLVLNTMGTPALLDDWKESYAYFFEKVHKEANYLDDAEWNKAVKVLQDNFIKVEKCDHGMFVDFHNPGIIDVLSRYINSNEKKRHLLLQHSFFIEQFFREFHYVIGNNGCVDNKVALSIEVKNLIIEVFERIWGKYKSCRIFVFRRYNGDWVCYRFEQTKAQALVRLLKYDELFSMDYSYIEQKVTQQLMTEVDETHTLSQVDFRNKLDLLNIINVSKTSLNMEDLFNAYKKRLCFGTDCLLFAKLIEKVLPEHVDYIKSEEFCTITAKCLNQELQHTNSIDLKELNSTAHELCQYLPKLKHESIIAEISERYKNKIEMHNKMQNLINTQMEILLKNFPEDEKYLSLYKKLFINPNSESRVIDNLFAAIKERD